MKLANKIGLASLLGSLGIAALIGSLGYFQARKALIDEEKHNLAALATAKKDALNNFFDDLRGSLGVVSRSPITLKALSELQAAYASLPAEKAPPSDFLKGFYSELNAICKQNDSVGMALPTGRTLALQEQYLPGAKADENHPYFAAHQNAHGFFANLQASLRLYDVFLINPDGDIVYSFCKETDVGRNLRQDTQLKDTALSAVFQSALGVSEEKFSDNDNQNQKIMKKSTLLSDFAFYAPSKGGSAMFAASPVLSRSNRNDPLSPSGAIYNAAPFYPSCPEDQS